VVTARRSAVLVPYTAEQMFALVADIERYPEFVPHCRALRVLSDRSAGGEGEIDAEMIVSYRAFRERFKCRVALDRSAHAIDVDYLDGPFRSLRTQWRFVPESGGCKVDFAIAFEFRSVLLQAAAASVFERAFMRMTDAFVARAGALYGTHEPVSAPSTERAS
jgi:coenzyme Q-binding protein COQ10